MQNPSRNRGDPMAIPATATDDTQVVFATAKEFCALAIVVTALYSVFVVAMATENTSCIVTTAIESRARTTAFYAVTSTGAVFVITTACADTVYIGTTARQLTVRTSTINDAT